MTAQHPPLDADGSVSSVSAGGITDVCFGHPKSNSLPSKVLRALADAIAAAGARAETRVIVLRSYGAGAFCAGASFDELVAIRDAAMGKEFFMGFARVIVAMTRCPSRSSRAFRAKWSAAESALSRHPTMRSPRARRRCD
jgi:Enoyl-CoA hydratase/carnithine racemase